uniref:Si:ch211-106h11.1 n=1 Tax=Danio rerio TaxID=7955 RepID=A0A8M9PTX1_DANRE|nr:volume-regulated anion channel subunit LRRC8D isoform X1 [Danio rerio]XP_021328304.1 volume-regulated anion channel subunit LRRC8D isoform X1 [Danio rerio]|eukprot:XP_021328302.1 volume-regulated anion channel subunit LRRC8D isoform X1 [Danio rerio]
MFALSELWSGGERQGSYKLLKPWWEVFMDYLLVLMLMVSILAGTLLLSRDGVVCVPVHSFPTNHTSTIDPIPETAFTSTSARGRRTNLDFQQYSYISQVCYHEALPWYSRFLPYVTLLHTLVLLASGCFWFHFPLTSARIEHFLSLLAKCCESPWTTRALSHTAKLDTRFSEAEPVVQPKAQVASSYKMRKSSLDSGTDSPLLAGIDTASTTTQPSPCPSTVSHCSAFSTRSLTEPVHAVQVSPDRSRPGATLDRSDREQARALFERVRRFRAHCESSDVIYKVYTAQTVFKVLKFVLIVSYTTPLLSCISFSHVCRPHSDALIGYSEFQCSHPLSSVLRQLMQAYVSLLFLFGLLAIYALFWILHKSLRQYSFQTLREKGSMLDAPDLHNDLAFLLHMADQYDPLLAQRLSVFLSPVSETRLLQESVERCWGAERLRAITSSDQQGRSVLQLVALPHLPPALFSFSTLQVLKLELIADAKLTAQITNMSALRELHLYHCSASVDPGALQFLQEHLEVLHLTFTTASEIPGWVYSLRGLQELQLTGRLGSEGGMGRGWTLGSLRQLRHLRVLVLRGTLQKVPAELSELAGSLLKLEIHNEGTRLLVLTGLRRVPGLTELHLQGCQLERLPSALLALSGLRSLDLQHNSLRTLEELLGLQHLRRLSCLRLAHNQVLSLPASVGVLRALELLDLAYNQLQTLPSALFTLHRLRRLLLAGNLLQDLPADIAALRLLNELDLSANKLERLPAELFVGCVELRVLNVASNSLCCLPAGVSALTLLSRLDVRGNSLEVLPLELGCCSGLRGGGLLVEGWLMHTLPPQVRDALLSEAPSRPSSECFPRFPSTQWSFHSALESRI